MLKRIVTIAFCLFVLVSFSERGLASSSRQNRTREKKETKAPSVAKCKLCQKNKPVATCFPDSKGNRCYFCKDCEPYAACEFCGGIAEWHPGGPDEHIYICVAHDPTAITTKAEADKNLNEVREVLSTMFGLKINGKRECILVAPKELKNVKNKPYECGYGNYGFGAGQKYQLAKGLPYDFFRYFVAHLILHDWVEENFPHLKGQHDTCEGIAFYLSGQFEVYEKQRLYDIQYEKIYANGPRQLTEAEESELIRRPHDFCVFPRDNKKVRPVMDPRIYESLLERNKADAWKEILLKEYPVPDVKSSGKAPANSKQTKQNKKSGK